MRGWSVRGFSAQRSRWVSTFRRGEHDPYNAICRRVQPRKTQDGPMTGWAVSIKDNISMSHEPLACSSRMLKDFQSPFDAGVVQKLEAAGANIMARTNCDEFAMGALNQHSIYGPVANPAIYADPRDPDLLKTDLRAPGGSSGGAAASVAAGLCRVAIGTDTGGSTRLPGAFCGVYGFKPSYGMISRWGIVSYADSLDTVGILGTNVSDVSTTFDAVAEEDPRDETCIDNHLRARLKKANSDRISEIGQEKFPLHGLRVGVPAEMYPIEMHQDTLEITDYVLNAMHKLGADIVPVRVPVMAHCIGAYYLLALAEASSNLSRFDGLGVPDERSFQDTIAKSRQAGFGDEVQRRILLGTYAVTTEAWESYYMAALDIRSQLMQELSLLWHNGDLRKDTSGHTHGVDLFVHPTSLQGAPKFDQDPASEYAQDALTTYANLAGIPVISAPARQRLHQGQTALPVGISFGSAWGYDQLVLHVVDQVHAHTDTLT